MDIVSTCPIRAAELPWVLSNGGPALTVVCKATFLLQQGDASLAPQQDPVSTDDAYWTEGGEKSLASHSDLAPFKPRADVVVVGSVFAPPQRTARSVLARVVVGSMDKAIEVCADRFLLQNGELREGAPWTKQRLGWDRAAGGPDSGNPAGMRFDVADALGATALPNLQPPGTHVARRGDTFGPVGFGPVPPGFPGRIYKLYRHSRTFLARDWNTRPLPGDIDPAFFNIAPPDQQLSELRGDDRLILDHLHPEHTRLVMTLPGTRPVVTVARAGRAPAPIQLACDTLWIDTDRGVCSLVWRGTLQLTQPGEPGQITVAMETGRGPATSAGRSTSAALTPQEGTALPFQRTGAFALQDLSSSVAMAPSSSAPTFGAPPPSFGAPPAPAPGAPSFAGGPATGTPSFVPPPRPSESGQLEPMRPRAMTMEIPAGSIPTQPPAASGLQSVLAQSGAARAALQQMGASAPVAPPVQPPPLAQAPLPAAPPAVAPPAIVSPSASGLGTSASWSLNAPEVRPPQGSIGERIAVEQAMAEAKIAQEKRGPDEVEQIGPLARSQAVPIEPPSSKEALPKRAPGQSARSEPKDALVLLWLDPKAVPRMRKKAGFREILHDLADQEPDAELDESVSGDVADIDDQRAVFEILAKGQSIDGEALQRAMIDGVRDDGKFVPPLVLLAGELSFPFDELETLRATVTTVAPLVGADEALKGAVETAREFLRTPDLACAPPVADGMIQRIRDAFAQGKRVVPAGYLEAQSERTLLENRHYQKRNVFGGPHLRAFLHLSGSSGPVPCYLPAEVTPKLPLFQRFRARLIATSHLPEDQNETQATALHVLAFARVAPAPGTSPVQPPRK